MICYVAYILQYIVTEAVPSDSVLPSTVWFCGARYQFASAFQKVEKLFDVV